MFFALVEGMNPSTLVLRSFVLFELQGSTRYKMLVKHGYPSKTIIALKIRFDKEMAHNEHVIYLFLITIRSANCGVNIYLRQYSMQNNSVIKNSMKNIKQIILIASETYNLYWLQ